MIAQYLYLFHRGWPSFALWGPPNVEPEDTETMNLAVRVGGRPGQVSLGPQFRSAGVGVAGEASHDRMDEQVAQTEVRWDANRMGLVGWGDKQGGVGRAWALGGHRPNVAFEWCRGRLSGIQLHGPLSCRGSALG